MRLASCLSRRRRSKNKQTYILLMALLFPALDEMVGTPSLFGDTPTRLSVLKQTLVASIPSLFIVPIRMVRKVRLHLATQDLRSLCHKTDHDRLKRHSSDRQDHET